MSKKTKIICTIGPASESKEVLTKLVEAGMNIARLNFSHGDYEEHAERVKRIREVSKETGKPIGILLDTKGPEIRLGDFEMVDVNLLKVTKLIQLKKKFQETTKDSHYVVQKYSMTYKLVTTF